MAFLATLTAGAFFAAAFLAGSVGAAIFFTAFFVTAFFTAMGSNPPIRGIVLQLRHTNSRNMRCFVLFVLFAISCLGLPEDPAPVRAAAEELERVRQLVAVGAAPVKQLKQAEERLEEAKESQILDKLLYSEIKIEDLTEAQAKEMVAVSGHFEQREQQRLDDAAKMVDIGLRSKNSLEPLAEGLARAQHTVAVAKSRAALVEELVGIVKAELEAESHPQPEMIQEPNGPRPIFERYVGSMLFGPKDLKKVMLAFEMKFAKPMPISARGETAVHRALGFDHRGRVDVALKPDQEEGVWLRHYLESAKIPYFAFRKWIPGQATAPHIHIGPPSTRLIAD